MTKKYFEITPKKWTEWISQIFLPFELLFKILRNHLHQFSYLKKFIFPLFQLDGKDPEVLWRLSKVCHLLGQYEESENNNDKYKQFIESGKKKTFIRFFFFDRALALIINLFIKL